MIDYIGTELELFKHAVNWKNYFSSSFREYIKGDVLEVGAGFGVNTSYLVTPACTSWTFVEPDSKLAGKIEDYTAGVTIPKKVIVGTTENVTSGTFDTIIYIDVLEHIERSVEEIQKAKDLLKPGGHLIILVPAFQFLFNEFDTQLGHFRRYDKPLLRSEIKSRLTEKKLYYLDSCGLCASIANKLFLKKSNINLSQVKFWDNVLVRISKISDIITFRSFGKSLIGVYEKTN
jgi:SAM-dependent methyltransferase